MQDIAPLNPRSEFDTCPSILTVRVIALHSTNRAPGQLHLPLHQSCNNKKQEKLQVVRGAQQGAPLTNTHVNGEPLSVFDDSSLSDVSDDEERYICSMPFLYYQFISLTNPISCY